MMTDMILGAAGMWLFIRFKPQLLVLKKALELKAERLISDLSK